MAGKVAEVVPNGSRARGSEISRDDLLDMALEIYDMAMAKTYKSGPAPELNSATKALELAAKLAGYLGDRALTPEQFKMELAKIGLEVRPKLKAAG